jgi:hypothetical protein
MYDLFVTHDWRDNNKDRNRALSLIDAVLGLKWRNYGNPWYDPAISISSPEGAALIRERLETQLIPAKAVLFIPSIYLDSQRGRTWVGLALERARQRGLPILGLAEDGIPPAEPALAALADRWVAWNGPAIVAAVDSLLGRR